MAAPRIKPPAFKSSQLARFSAVPPPPVLMPHGYIRSQPSYIPTIDDCNCKLRCILTIHPHVYCSEPLTVTLGVPGISAWAG